MTTEEMALWQRHRAGDAKARESLIERYLPLVETIARVFRNVRAEDRQDLKGAGFYGLVKAVDDWDGERMAWLDFARIKVRYAMVDQIRLNSWIPKSIQQRARRIEDSEERLRAALGREPTTVELAASLGLSEEECAEQVASFRQTDWAVASLEGKVEIEASWYESLPDPAAPDPEDKSLWAAQVDALELVLQRLPALDRQVLRWKFFTHPPVSQKEMARRLKVHESRVSQLLEAAIVKARKIAEQPFVMFPEVYEDAERFTSRD